MVQAAAAHWGCGHHQGGFACQKSAVAVLCKLYFPESLRITCNSNLYKNLGEPMGSAGSPMVTPLFKFLHLVEVVSHSHLTQVSSQAQSTRPYQLRAVLGQFQPGFHGYVDPVEALYRGQRPLL
jgi:hypothetical protein